uniref:Putative coat protein n=1 Tax=Rubber dandelion latent virus 2 TaxID=2175278 RepID=A0A2S1PH21_9VIRU|nr:putative coat protein [Rubber dandelion latent virus 2]
MEFVLEKTPAEEQAMLVEKAAPLIAFHFPASIFTRDAAIDAGYTFKSFLKHVTSVARYAESDQLRAICRLGIKHDIFELHQECSIDQFVRFSDFLKSKEGQAALQGVAIQTKLQKRAGTTFTPKDVALEQIFSIMRQDFHAAMKEEGAAFQKVLAELRLQIKKVEKEWEDRQAEIRAAFNPVSVYQEPSEKDIGVEAYAAYEKEAGLKNMVAKPKASGGLEYAIQNYGPQISRTRVVEFANLPEHHEGFFGYMKQRVLQFRTQFDTKQEKAFVNLVVAAGGGEIVITPEDEKVGPVLYVPRGVTSYPRAEAVLLPPVRPNKRGGDEQEGPSRRKGRKPSGKGPKTRSQHSKDAGEHSDSGSTAHKGGEDESHPHGKK